jgi:hypothetical protein
MSKDIFISHSHKDAAIAIALTDCLVSGCRLAYRDILCTSHPRQQARLRRGEDINQKLKKYLIDCRILVPIVSMSSIERNYVLFEIGGAWALDLHIMPVVVEKNVRDLMPEVIKGLLYTKYDDPIQIKELVLDIAEKCFVASDLPKEAEVDSAVRQYLRALKNA